MTKRERLAIHEAAHAVITTVFGGEVDFVTIVSDGDTAGRSVLKHQRLPDSVVEEIENTAGGLWMWAQTHEDEFAQWAVSEVIIGNAGQEAERLLLGETDPGQLAVEAEHPNVCINLREVTAPYDSDNLQMLDLLEALLDTDTGWVEARYGRNEAGDMHAELVCPRLDKRCEDLVREWEPAIRRVAAALLERDTLQGDEVREIVGPMQQETP